MGADNRKINGSKTNENPKCGIVMPISMTDGCTAEHWAEVLGIIKDVIQSIGLEPNLVSDADDIGIIQKRIIQNLYNNDIVVCDVSAKNPNVMFELGIRLAFDKPTIIIKDDHTDYTFDTSIIEHIGYPRDLRFNKILVFKENLKKKITATLERSRKDPNYSTFLKNFGEYKIAHLEEKQVSSDKYIMNALEEIKYEIAHLKRSNQVKEPVKVKLGSLEALRQKIQQEDITDQIGNIVKRYLESTPRTQSEILNDEKLLANVVDFAMEHIKPQKNISRDEVRSLIYSELLPF
jgi:hypothetical protein